MEQKIDISSFRKWFLKNKRSFPWRENPTPYRVWISEIMLQQTRAAAVIPYFNKWMEKFPDVFALAKATEEEVIKTWEGLGYYSRARNIHKAAKLFVERYDGSLPADKEKLLEIKGLGEYTVGAILNFAFNQRVPAVDGNVLRVLSRQFLFTEDITKVSSQKKIREMTESILPKRKPWEISEALIELGAVICKPKNPECEKCPISLSCLAKKKNKVLELPVKTKKTKTIDIHRMVALISYKDTYIVQKVVEGKVMQGLWEFPYLEFAEKKISHNNLIQWVEDKLLKDITIKDFSPLPVVKHTFTKYRATLYPVLIELKNSPRNKLKNKSLQHLKLEEVAELPFSSGHRKIYQKNISDNFIY